MEIKGAVLDLDGTLLDSLDIWDTVAGIYLESIGCRPQENLNEVIRNMSLFQAAGYLRRQYDIPLSQAEITDGIYTQLKKYYRGEVRLKAGVRDLLLYLRQKGIRMCVATAGDRRLAQAALKRCGIFSAFEGIIACDELYTGKNKPEIYEQAMKLLGTRRAETLVFEDALYALQTAKKAGCMTVAVYDCHEMHQNEMQVQSDLYLKDFTHLEELDRMLSA